MPEGPCFNQIFSKIILKNVTPRKCDNRVRKFCREYYLVEPGYEFREVPILLSIPMLVGIVEEEGRVLMPFRKPCYGTSLYLIEATPEEIEILRADLSHLGPPEPVKKPKVRKTRQKRPA